MHVRRQRAQKAKPSLVRPMRVADKRYESSFHDTSARTVTESMSKY